MVFLYLWRQETKVRKWKTLTIIVLETVKRELMCGTVAYWNFSRGLRSFLYLLCPNDSYGTLLSGHCVNSIYIAAQHFHFCPPKKPHIQSLLCKFSFSFRLFQLGCTGINCNAIWWRYWTTITYRAIWCSQNAQLDPSDAPLYTLLAGKQKNSYGDLRRCFEGARCSSWLSRVSHNGSVRPSKSFQTSRIWFVILTTGRHSMKKYMQLLHMHN